MSTNTYSASDVILAFGGYSVIGWDEMKITHDTNTSTFVRGIRNKNTRVINENTSAIISVTCPNTSFCNEVFRQILFLDRYTGGNARMDISLSDINGSLVASCPEAFVVGYPELSYTNSIEKSTWQIQCYSLKYSVNNTQTQSSSLLDVGTNLVKKLF